MSYLWWQRGVLFHVVTSFCIAHFFVRESIWYAHENHDPQEHKKRHQNTQCIVVIIFYAGIPICL